MIYITPVPHMSSSMGNLNNPARYLPNRNIHS
jgi:hypothetical protein